MTRQLLPIWIANAEYESEAILSQIPIDSLTWKQALGISERFQIMAVGYYLSQDDINAFKRHLSRSVDFYLNYLGATEKRPPTSKVMAFIHAVILERFADACVIAQQSLQNWYQGYEYRDDMLFMRTLMAWAEQKPQYELENLASQIAEFETDKNRHLIAVCRAIAQKSEPSFEQALQGYLNFHLTYYREGFDKGHMLEQEYWLYRNISLVGIAMHKLCKQQGFQLKTSYRAVPKVLTKLNQ